MQRYETYYPVDFDYVKELPTGWQLLPNIAIFDERIQRGNVDEELLAVTISRGIIRQSELKSKKDISNEDKSAYKLVKKGDLAYNKMRMWQGSVGNSQYQGIVSPAYIVLKPKIPINPKFFHYQYRSKFYINYSKRASYGICDDQLSLRYKDFKRMLSIVPPLEVQNEIVEYLDSKLFEVEQYRSQKQNIIKLNDDLFLNFVRTLLQVEDKESKDIWKLKYVSKIKGRIGFRGYTTSDLVEKGKGAFALGATHITPKGKLDLTKEVYISWQKYFESPEIMVKKDNLLLVQRGSTCGKVGFVNDDIGEATINPSLVLIKDIRKKQVLPEFLMFSIQASIHHLIQLIANTAIPMLSQEQISNLKIYVPDVKAQKKTLEAIHDEQTQLEQLSISLNKEIDQINRYETELIENVILGQYQVGSTSNLSMAAEPNSEYGIKE